MAAAEKKIETGASIVVLTEAQLRALIGDAVREAMGGASNEVLEYLTLEQAAELLQASTRSLRTWVRDAGLPALRVGSEYRFKRASIVSWLEQRALIPGVHISRVTERLKKAK